MRAVLPALVSTLFLAVGCATSGPSGTFDDYFEAYAAGDVARVWDLSSPAARDDALRIRKELFGHLESDMVEERVEWEGQFGVTADDLRDLDERAFFEWAVSTIRRRVGGSAVRALVSRIQRIREEALGGDTVVIVYRVGEELSRLPLVRTGDGWRVDQSPFPQPAPPEATPQGTPSATPQGTPSAMPILDDDDQ